MSNELKKLAATKNDALADLQASQEERNSLQQPLDEMAKEREKLKEKLALSNQRKQTALASVAAKDEKSARVVLEKAREDFRADQAALADHDELVEALEYRLENELGEEVMRELNSTAQHAEKVFWNTVFEQEAERFRRESAERMDQIYLMSYKAERIVHPDQFVKIVMIGDNFLYGKPPEDIQARAQQIESKLLG